MCGFIVCVCVCVIVIIGIIGYAIEIVMRKLEARLIPWKGKL